MDASSNRATALKQTQKALCRSEAARHATARTAWLGCINSRMQIRDTKEHSRMKAIFDLDGGYKSVYAVVGTHFSVYLIYVHLFLFIPR